MRSRLIILLLCLLGATVVFGALSLGSGEMSALVQGDSSDQLFHCMGCMEDLALTSDGEGWAVGYGAFLLHVHKGQLSWVDSPGSPFLTAVTLVSPGEGWAVGAAILHLHNGHWETVSTGQVTGGQVLLFDVSMSSADEGWAVGDGDAWNSHQGLLLHYHDGAWKPAPLLPNVSLTSVSLVSRDEGWAVGDHWNGDHEDHGVILHYANGTWTSVASPPCLNCFMVTMRSSDDGWLIGSDATSGYDTFYRYVSGTWRPIQSEPGIDIFHLAVNPSGEAWATGDSTDSTGVPLRSMVYHFDGATWQMMQSSASVGYGSLATSGNHDVWLLGNAGLVPPAHGILAHVTASQTHFLTIPYKPPESGLLRLLFPVTIPVMTVLALAGLVLLVLALRTPAPSLWHRWLVRLMVVGLIALAFGPDMVLLASTVHEIMPDVVQTIAEDMVIAGMLLIIVCPALLRIRLLFKGALPNSLSEAFRLGPRRG